MKMLGLCFSHLYLNESQGRKGSYKNHLITERMDGSEEGKGGESRAALTVQVRNDEGSNTVKWEGK